MKIQRTLIGCALSLSLLLTASIGSAQTPATDHVREQANEVIQIVNGVEDRAERIEQLKLKTREILDFPLLAERTLGQHWDARTEAEREEFIGLIRELIETSYSKELGDEQLEDDDYRVQFVDERERRGSYTIDSIVEVRGDAKFVSIRMLRGEDESWRVYDVITDDVSLVESYAESFDEIITEHGWGELTKRIRDRIDALKNDEAGSAE